MTPKPPRKSREPKMTIAMCFNCFDGIVLCADSLESNGLTKRNVPKIWCHQVGDEWGISIASAGDGDLADWFNEQLETVVGNGDFDEQQLTSRLRSAIFQVRESYPRDELMMLVGVYSNVLPAVRRVYRVYDKHLGPVRTYQSIGCGAFITDFICAQIHTPNLSARECARLGILAIARAKDIIEGCGGSTQVVSYFRGEPAWDIKPTEEIEAIEKEFGEDEFRAHLQKYWIEKNPKSDFPRSGYRWTRPFGVKYKMHAKLNTMPSEPQMSED